MVTCSAFKCKSRSDKKEPGVTFHRFPKDPERRKRWVLEMRLADWTATNNDRVCSKHFEERWFYKCDTKRRLLDLAVPTIFPEFPKYLQKKKTPQRSSMTSSRRLVKSLPSTSHDSEMIEEASPSRATRRSSTTSSGLLVESVPPVSDGSDSELEEKPRPSRECFCFEPQGQESSLRNKLFQLQVRSREKSKKIRVLNQKVRRYKETINALKTRLKILDKSDSLAAETILIEIV